MVLAGPAYRNGQGDYAGLNFIPVRNPTASIIASQAANFTTSSREKLYARKSGIAGIHEAGSSLSLPNVYGYMSAHN